MGVLLESRGYRAGLLSSNCFFLSELGLDDRWLPVEREVAALETHDRPFLLPQTAARLEKMRAQQQLALVVFTARPSLPINGQRAVHAGYSPEAEVALRLLEMSRLPRVGYGAMIHVADRTGLRADSLLKPAALLERNGIDANVNAWGIATDNEKQTALEKVGAVLFQDVNQALRAAFPQWF